MGVIPKPPVKVLKDGSEICNLKTAEGRREYRRRTEKMAVAQKMICGICGNPSNLMSMATGFDFSVTFDHGGAGRGMNGSKRDDRPFVKGNSAAHCFCNTFKSQGKTL